MLLAALMLLPACASGSFSMKQAEVDRSLYTSDIPADAKKQTDGLGLPDELTIRNAVSSADIESLGDAPVAWANSESGARGSITDLAEYKEGGLLCRRFTTTRENYDGVLLFKGEACMSGAGGWRMKTLSTL
jgi:hypothetical protein